MCFLLKLGILISILIIALLGWRYSHYYPQSGGYIDADITSSFGSILGATLTPLWSIIATIIYWQALNVQAEELKVSQEIGFSQNLNTLITYSKDILNRIAIKPYNRPIYKGNEAILFLYISLKYMFCITKKEHIMPILDLERYIEENKEFENCNYEKLLDDFRLYEHEMESLRRDNLEEYRKNKKEKLFNKYKPYFIFLYELSDADTKWKEESDQEYAHIKCAFDKVWIKYGHKADAYFQGIELAIDYIGDSNYSISQKKTYARWITANLSQTTLLFFNYYLYCQREKKGHIIKYCKELDFFERIDKTKLIDENTNYLI